MNFRLGTSKRVVALGPLLGSGGEGSVFEVLGQPDLAVKLYGQFTNRQTAKLKAMIGRCPASATTDPAVRLAWPASLVYSSTNSADVVGFAMLRTSATETLFEYWSRIAYAEPWTEASVLQVVRNVARGVATIHASTGVVCGDVNGVNVLVDGAGNVTLVDLDSCQVAVGSDVFCCDVGRREYLAPELQGKNLRGLVRSVAHDNFALAVLIFQVLMRGYHPFSAQFVGVGTRLAQGERIQRGLWPYRVGGAGEYRPPRSAPPFAGLPQEVRRLFYECFELGHVEPARRPSAEEWAAVIEGLLVRLSGVAANPRLVGNQRAAAWLYGGIFKRRAGWRWGAVASVIGVTVMGGWSLRFVREPALPFSPGQAGERAMHVQPSRRPMIGRPAPYLWRALDAEQNRTEPSTSEAIFPHSN